MTLKSSDGEAPALEICGMQSTSSLSLLQDPHWTGVVVPDRVLFMGQIEQMVYKQGTDIKLWQLYSNTWNHLTMCKKSSGSFKNAIFKTCS